ncbi:hypothetical protein KUTeg_008778 [Tegillarca granosa]|uniref:Methyltransferase FkbM domain-containing protein n=1 Tax=Tegillarca granosa TaxID=220873 RepID=A0ABQ9FEE2_TEGGR|nr:hypothetical protein KUTeg_008778 [Tegillarca granosa]
MIEADPTNFASLKKKHRKAFITHSCLSPNRYPAKMTFNQAFNRGRLVYGSAKQWIKEQKILPREIQVQCFPLYSILLALNQSTIDFLSLDVEGSELDVLQTIPFDKVDIKMITAEVAHQKLKMSMQKFMAYNGYETLLKMQRDDGGVNDIIFRKKGR